MNKIKYDKKTLFFILLAISTIFFILIGYRLKSSRLMSSLRVYANKSSNDFFGSINADFIDKSKAFEERQGNKIKGFKFLAEKNLGNKAICRATAMLSDDMRSEGYYYFGAKLDAGSDKKCFDNNNDYNCLIYAVYEDNKEDKLISSIDTECSRNKWISLNYELSSRRSKCDKYKGEWCKGFWIDANKFSNCNKLSEANYITTMMEYYYYEDEDLPLILKNGRIFGPRIYGYGYEDIVCCDEPCSLNLQLCPANNTYGFEDRKDCNNECTKGICEFCQDARLERDGNSTNIKVDAIKYYCPYNNQKP